MNVINVAGIPFTEKILTELENWIVPPTDFDVARIDGDIKLLLKLQSFVISNWDCIDFEDFNMKTMLIEIDYLRRTLEKLNTIKIEDHA